MWRTKSSSLFLSTDDLYDKKALQEYILYAGQHPVGGLRGKPPKYFAFAFRLTHSDMISIFN